MSDKEKRRACCKEGADNVFFPGADCQRVMFSLSRAGAHGRRLGRRCILYENDRYSRNSARVVEGESSDSNEGCNIKFAIIDLCARFRRDDKRSKISEVAERRVLTERVLIWLY